MLKYRNFISKFNLVNGKMEWIMVDNNYDFKHEIRNSGYVDMLNDSDRNIKYYKALKKVIQQMKNKNMKVHVLDIGCGTGILSMMAIKLGADKVTACESFQPMYECAKIVLKQNNMITDKIDLIFCNSVDLKVGLNMKEKANVLVSEIFDTELIGEGVLHTFNHALKHLLTENAIVIPFKAKIYVQILDSEFLRLHNWLKKSKYFPKFPSSYHECTGYSSVFDIQASALINYPHVFVGQPMLATEIIFNKASETFNDKVFCSTHYNGDINSFSCVMWWELVMVVDCEDSISTAPSWINEKANCYYWRDHWLQGVYSLPNMNEVFALSKIDFNLCHDAFSFWVEKYNPNSTKTHTERSFCTCGLHLHIPHNRLYHLNSTEYSNQVDYITQFGVSKKIRKAVVISDLSYLTVSLPLSGVATHTIIDNYSIRKLMLELIELNKLEKNKITLSSLEDFIPDYFDTVGIFGDPYFIYSIFPWDNLHFWYAAEHIRKQFPGIDCYILPQKMRIRGVLVKFDRLHKINKPIKFINDFDLGPFDDIIHKDVDNDNLCFESKFLWEYDSYIRSEICDLITIDMRESIDDLCNNNVTELIGSHVFKSVDWSDTNGLVLWTVWELSDNVWIDNSLQFIDFTNGRINWKPITKQGVHFLFDSQLQNCSEVEFKCTLNVQNSNFRFSMIT